MIVPAIPSQAAAPGHPGVAPRWTSSAKSGVGTALSPTSRVWFTLSHGVLDEIYYPRVDHACTRDLGLMVADGVDFFSEEKRDCVSEVALAEDGVPAYRLTNRCRSGAYVIDKTVLCDPHRDVVLQSIRFTALAGGPAAAGAYRLYALLSPHLVNGGAHNTAWVDCFKGHPFLFAEGEDGTGLALACSEGWADWSVGFVGATDGWQDIARDKRLTQRSARAQDGNVALTGEIPLRADGGAITLALGFGRRAEEAAHRVISSLQDGFEAARRDYVAGWRAWQGGLERLGPPLAPNIAGSAIDAYRVSTLVLKTHAARSFPGGYIASLSIPWGFNKGDDDLGGYHLVWPRDLVETAGGLLAIGAHQEARDVLFYLQATQEADGHWPQNMWLDGGPYWNGVQMDECAFPILLVDLARRCGALSAAEVLRLQPMVRRAAAYLVQNGPVTGQDRWEEDGGYSPFTLAVEIAGLLAAAELLEPESPADAVLLRDAADWWNEQIEHWTFASGSAARARFGVEGYYVRIAPMETADAASPIDGFVPIKNRPNEAGSARAVEILSPDALALVRFGLRAADDPRIVDTVRAIDTLLRVELPQGPVWRRYNGDGYGEHEDGAPFDGVGVGRAWPLLTGERAHYELALGRTGEARRLLATLENCGSPGALLPEQVWDAADIPERELFRGKPSGSAMPLVWAHGEHVKLLRSLRDGAVFDQPPQTVQRYQVEKVKARCAVWSLNQKTRAFAAGKLLRIDAAAPFRLVWSGDGWATKGEIDAAPSGLGIASALAPTGGLAAGSEVVFTLFWTDHQRWEGANFTVAIL